MTNKINNEEVVFCKDCVESNQRYVSSILHKDKKDVYKPKTLLSRENNVCAACNYFKKKKTFNWKDRWKSSQTSVINLEEMTVITIF